MTASSASSRCPVTMALASASASRIGQHEGGVVFGSIGQLSPMTAQIRLGIQGSPANRALSTSIGKRPCLAAVCR